MSDLKTIEKNVHLLLLKYPKLRSIYERKRAIFKYWQEFEQVNDFGITEEKFIKLTNAETISRAIRKVLHDYPDLRLSISAETKRYETAELFKNYYKHS